MNEEELKKWRQLLGEDFSAAELEAFLQEHPDWSEGPEFLAEAFRKARRSFPTLSSDFTAQVMDRLASQPRPSAVLPLRRPVWRRWVFASGFAAAAALSLVWYRSDKPHSHFPGAEIREAQAPSGETVYFVRFVIERKGAAQVALAGDFNQWTPVPLQASSEQPGVFTLELPLSEGIYSYAFLVDGQKWIADEGAERLVEDGFGGRNSVLQI